MRRAVLHDSWKVLLGSELEQNYMEKLKEFLVKEKNNKIIYPKDDEIFKAFEYTPFDQVKVVIIGQDPYHGPNQAHGLCFSVKPNINPPPSLQNIYKELEQDLGYKPVKHGFLIHWAKQGVLMLNSVLTVEEGNAGAHQGRGWEQFTDKAIEEINSSNNPIVFILWGNYAHKKGKFINEDKHLVIRSVHPSPLSAHRGFFGSTPFSQANKFLETIGRGKIDWQLPNKATYD